MDESLAQSPVVVLGAPRSGTSLLAAWLHHSGISMGEDFLAPDEGNPAGYFEDLDFLNLHRQFLKSSEDTVGRILEDSSMREESFDFIPNSEDLYDAAALVEARQEFGMPWGWKDPRSCYFLDFWNELLPETRYILIYRHPLEMAASLVRMGQNWDCLFDALLPVRTWTFSMREVLRFAQCLPEQGLRVLAAEAMWDQPDRLEADFAEKWQLPLKAATLEALRTSESATAAHGINARQHAVFSKYFPQAAAVFEQLQELAGVPASLSECPDAPDPILDFLEQYEVDPEMALQLLYDSTQPFRRETHRCARQRMIGQIKSYLSERFDAEEALQIAYDEQSAYVKSLLGRMKELQKHSRDLLEHCKNQKAHIENQVAYIDELKQKSIDP